MVEPAIRFDDGAAYEEFMGKWSHLAGDIFLQWLRPPAHLRWVDVGCGNGAFTQMLVDRCSPTEVHGIDPSESQLSFARTRLSTGAAQFDPGDAVALPYADDTFDAAVMALVIFFVPDPAKGVAEMARVVKPGGMVCAYSWDILAGGFPFAVIQEEMAALGTPALWPPSVEASRVDVMRTLWAGAGLVDIETHPIAVERTFADFDTFWKIARTGPRVAPRMAALSPADVDRLKTRVHDRLAIQANGQVTVGAKANAIKGHLAPTDASRFPSRSTAAPRA
jgi:SAM-dependent methyltransferase